ncbi:MAG: multicopper oxidase domain-containing protein [Deferribacteres bacterium]|nr:multicopper oxidase domain-containing protein [Deferribacteres bacterium]
MRTQILFCLFFTLTFANAQNQITIPDTLNGTVFNLNLQNGTYQFYAGQNTQTMGVNGAILGPTLIVNKGDFIDITVNNHLEDTTTIHWHGMHVSAANDGGPHTTIAPGASWNPRFTVLDKAGTYWYHPHLHEKTNLHVSKGIAGFIIVRDSEEAALELPRTYGVDDFPLVIQTKTFDANKKIVVPSNADTVLIVNATIDAALNVPAQVVRLRLLNGSSQRNFNIGLSDNRTFYQIGSDGGLLSVPNAVERLRLTPGERAEILLDFSNMQGQTLSLMSYAAEFANGIYGATNPGMGMMMSLNNYNPNPMNGTNFPIMQFIVTEKIANAITEIPTTLATVSPIPESAAVITRNLSLTAASMGPNSLNGKFLINNASFDMDVINYTIPLDNVEIWSITNLSPIAHPFHIHDVQFFILDRNGRAPVAAEQGRKDVVLIHPMETVRFITKFADFADDPVPYMYHCHMLTHEDDGMMGQFKVVSTTNVVENKIDGNETIAVYPNPATSIINISVRQSRTKLKHYKLYDTRGRTVLEGDFSENSDLVIDLKNIASGIYILEFNSEKQRFIKKITKL